jgi:outer membrane protein
MLKIITHNLLLCYSLLLTFGAQNLKAQFSDKAIAKGTGVYVVDVKKVVAVTNIGLAARNKVESEVRKGESQLAKLKEDYQKLYNDVNSQSGIISEEALNEKRKELREKQGEVELSYRQLNEKVLSSNQETIEGVVKKINGVIDNLAKENSSPFILAKDPSLVVYAADRIDLTKEVVTQVNRQYP